MITWVLYKRLSRVWTIHIESPRIRQSSEKTRRTRNRLNIPSRWIWAKKAISITLLVTALACQGVLRLSYDNQAICTIFSSTFCSVLHGQSQPNNFNEPFKPRSRKRPEHVLAPIYPLRQCSESPETESCFRVDSVWSNSKCRAEK